MATSSVGPVAEGPARSATEEPARSATIRHETTDLLAAWHGGDPSAPDRLLARLHDELRRLARRAMMGEREGHTLQPTALVHEAFLRLAGSEVAWQDRRHFFAVAAGVMRRVLVDHARALARHKRGSGAERLCLRESDAVCAGPDVDILDLDQALRQLDARDPLQCRIVELHYFGGLTYPEIAEATGRSRATVGRELRFAKAWLKGCLRST